MKKFWENLGARERLIVVTGTGITVLALLVQFVILPLWEERQHVSRAVDRQEKVLAEMNSQLADFLVLRRDTDSLQKALASRPPNFSLYSYVERKAREAGVRSNVKSINPSRGTVAGPYEETLADVSLEKITTRQLVQFLYVTDSPGEAVRIRKLTVRKSMESPDYLTATVQLSTYQAGAGPKPGPAPVRQGA